MTARGLIEAKLEPGMTVTIYTPGHPETQGEIEKVGRKWVYVRPTDADSRSAENCIQFAVDGQYRIIRGGRASGFLTEAQISEWEVRLDALAVLRRHGLGAIDSSRVLDCVPTDVLAELARVLTERACLPEGV
jgi:hypothetical protein